MEFSGTKPDVIVLCINYHDEMPYIRNTMHALTGLTDADIKKETDMNAKKKILSIGNKKWKSKDVENWDNLMEEYAPGLYDNYRAVGEKEAIEQVKQLQPEIIMMTNRTKGVLELLTKKKQIHPEGAVFVTLADAVDDEQAAMDEFKARGAYKCYSNPLSVDTLVHDMYVALNME